MQTTPQANATQNPITTTRREGALMVLTTIETRPAVVSFADILAAVRVETDEFFDVFGDCDTYAHSLTHPTDRALNHLARAFCGGYLIEIAPDFVPSMVEYHRENGASKQAAAEVAASAARQYIDDIRSIKQGAKNFYYVGGSFYGETAELGGIDGADYAETIARPEIALEIAAQLEAKGYTVTDKPSGDREAQRREFRETLKRQINAQNWQHDSLNPRKAAERHTRRQLAKQRRTQRKGRRARAGK